jgi:hypothetical protein
MRVWVSSFCFKLKMDDTQTWTIFLRKRWIEPTGRQGKQNQAVMYCTQQQLCADIYNVGQLGETWNAQERRQSGAAMAATATCTSSLLYGPRLLHLSGRRSSPELCNFWTVSCLEISVSKLMFLTLYYQHTRCLCLCEYSHFGAAFSTLHFRALASCWKWRRNCGFVAWSWLGASHCCSHIIRLCTHAENMLGLMFCFLSRTFGKGLGFSVWNLLLERCAKRSSSLRFGIWEFSSTNLVI